MQIQNLLGELHSVNYGLLMYKKACWFTRGSVIEKIVQFLEEIRKILTNKKLSFQELSARRCVDFRLMTFYVFPYI
jgi:adenylate kinase